MRADATPREQATEDAAQAQPGRTRLELGAVVLAETGRSIEDFAREHLFTPLGIDDVPWQRHADRAPMPAHALWLTPRELAKLGELVLERGSYRSR